MQSFLVSSASTGEWEYDVDTVTDQPDQLLVEDIIREKLFLHLDKEIPYVITQVSVPVWSHASWSPVVLPRTQLFGRKTMKACLLSTSTSTADQACKW